MLEIQVIHYKTECDQRIVEYFPNNATLFMETTKSTLSMHKGKVVLTTYAQF